MERVINKYDSLATLQPVVNGIGGNLVAIQSSRLSTWLHQCVYPGQLPDGHKRACVIPGKTFIGKG